MSQERVAHKNFISFFGSSSCGILPSLRACALKHDRIHPTIVLTYSFPHRPWPKLRGLLRDIENLGRGPGQGLTLSLWGSKLRHRRWYVRGRLLPLDLHVARLHLIRLLGPLRGPLLDLLLLQRVPPIRSSPTIPFLSRLPGPQ